MIPNEMDAFLLGHGVVCIMYVVFQKNDNCIHIH